MKKAGSVLRRVAKTRLSLLVVLSILAAAFMTATTLMKSGGGGRGNSGSHSDGKPSAEAPIGGTPAFTAPAVAPAVFGGDVRNLPHVPQRDIDRPEHEAPPGHKPPAPLGARPLEALNIALAPMPSASQNFPGMSRTDICTGGQCGAGIPPDTNGDVGPNHYIQAVNSAYAIYDKATGNLLASFTENSLFSGGPTGTVCDGNSFGDPVVVYDALADRWILSNFAFSISGGVPVSPFYQCIAASRTSNPVTGGWNLYAIRTDTGSLGQPPVSTLNDYPKFGIWSDCLYYSANGFAFPAGSFNGTEFASFSRSDMYAGLPLTMALGFIASAIDPFGMVPSNLAAPSGSPPPPGTPNYYVSESNVAFAYEVRKFTAGANCGAGGILSAATNVSQGSYSLNGGSIVPQPSPATSLNMLDSLIDRLMQKVQYRRVGNTESLWVVHSVEPTTGSTVRPQWAQLDVTGGAIATSPVQEQIYAPDTTLYRWMGSIAADKQGNVALGYSTSNATSPNFPSIAYSGRLAGDPLNTLPQSETQLIAGSGSQINNCGGAPCHRWGDYSAMSVDPSDGCTFWYTNEYYVSQTGGNGGAWNTRIGSFKFPGCSSTSVTPTSTPTTTPTMSVTPTPTPTMSGLFTITPCRLIDTRNAVGPYGGPALTAGTSRSFVLAGQCGIPLTARAVALNVVVVSPTTGPGHLTVYPAGTALPGTTTLNYVQGDIRANNAIVSLGLGGSIAVFCGQGFGTADLVVDTIGYFQ